MVKFKLLNSMSLATNDFIQPLAFACLPPSRYFAGKSTFVASDSRCANSVRCPATLRIAAKSSTISAYPTDKESQPSVEMSTSSTGTSTLDEELLLQSPDGTQIAAFLTVPQQPVVQPDNRAVILLSDILGYKNEDTRAVARLFASSGLITIVPDLFRQQPWVDGRDKTEYESWRALHDPVTVRGDLVLARDALTQRGYGTSLGLLGFCFGGGRLMEEVALNTRGLNPNAVAVFYPTRFDAEDVGRNATCPILLQTGDQDDLVPTTVVETLRETLLKNKNVRTWGISSFPGLGHAFAHHPTTDEDKAKSKIALDEAVEWLHKHL